MTIETPDSKVMDLLKKMQREKDQQEVIVENQEDYKRALNRIAKSKDGQHVIKLLMKFCGVYSVSNHNDVIRMAEERARRSVYLAMIRPYLTPTIRAEIEE